MNLKKYALYFTMILTVYSHSIAHANTEEWKAITIQSSKTFNNYLDAIGVAYEQEGSTITIVVNQQKALEGMPSLKRNGLINPELTQAFVNTHLITVSAYIGFVYTGVILIYIYKNAPLEKTHVNIYVVSPDNYGNNMQHLIASFEFSRNLFNKINWDNFDSNMMSNLFQKVSPDFKYSEWYKEKTQEENIYYHVNE